VLQHTKGALIFSNAAVLDRLDFGGDLDSSLREAAYGAA
jgi:hypothetical protein